MYYLQLFGLKLSALASTSLEESLSIFSALLCLMPKQENTKATEFPPNIHLPHLPTLINLYREKLFPYPFFSLLVVCAFSAHSDILELKHCCWALLLKIDEKRNSTWISCSSKWKVNDLLLNHYLFPPRYLTWKINKSLSERVRKTHSRGIVMIKYEFRSVCRLIWKWLNTSTENLIIQLSFEQTLDCSATTHSSAREMCANVIKVTIFPWIWICLCCETLCEWL